MTRVETENGRDEKKPEIFHRENFTGLELYPKALRIIRTMGNLVKAVPAIAAILFSVGIAQSAETETKGKSEMMPTISGNAANFAAEWVGNRFGGLTEINRMREEVLEKKTKAGNREKNLEIYLGHVKMFAPHWLEEFKALDKALGWPENAYAEFNAPSWPAPPENPPAPRECTSWLLFPDLTGGKDIILHKNRDTTVRRIAVAMIQRPGCYRWLGGGNLAVISPAFAINEKGLALVMNNADGTDHNNDAGFSTLDILRLLAEKCANVDEALEALEQIIKANAYSHGRTGSIWMMADTRRGAVLEHNAKYFTSAPVTFGLTVRANIWHLPGMAGLSKNTAKQLLGDNHREYHVRCGLMESFRKNGKIALEDIFRVSRAREGNIAEERFPVCWDNTNSAASFVPDPEFPDVLSTAYIAMGPPRNMVYFPIPMAAKAIPRAMFNGEWAKVGHDFKDVAGMDYFRLDPPRFERIVSLEKELLEKYREVHAKARELLRQGKRDEAVELLNRNLEKQSAKALETMKKIAANIP